ncbi:hypothetical protein OKHIL_17020 [Mycolicibacterium mageritense]
MTDRHDEDADDKSAPKVTNLTSGLGWTDPDRHRNDTYPPSWGYQRGH